MIDIIFLIILDWLQVLLPALQTFDVEFDFLVYYFRLLFNKNI